MKYVYDIENYVGYEKLKEMTAICHEELKNVDWMQLIENLKLCEKDNDVKGPSWHYGTGNADILHEIVDSVNQAEVSEIPEGMGSWLWIMLEPANNDHNGFKINPLIKRMFPNTIKSIQSLPGIFHVHLNRITPNFRIPPHTDALTGNVLSVVLTLEISSTNPELVTLNVSGNIHNFKDVEYFVFKSSYSHFVDNLSDSDWVVMSLQINQEFFYENIIK